MLALQCYYLVKIFIVITITPLKTRTVQFKDSDLPIYEVRLYTEFWSDAFPGAASDSAVITGIRPLVGLF